MREKKKQLIKIDDIKPYVLDIYAKNTAETNELERRTNQLEIFTRNAFLFLTLSRSVGRSVV